MPKLVAAVMVMVAAIARNGQDRDVPAPEHDEPEDRQREQREVLERREPRLPFAASFEHAVQEDVLVRPEEVPHARDAEHHDRRHQAQVVLDLGGAHRAPGDLVRRLVAEEVDVGAGDVAELRLEVGRALG